MEKLKLLWDKWNQKPFIHRLWVVLTLLVVLVVEGREYLKTHSSASAVRVISVRRDLMAGSVLSIQDLSVTRVDLESKGEYFDEQDLHEVIGGALSEDLKANQPVPKRGVREANSKRFSIKVPKGLRAYSIQLLSHLPIEPKDRVDIIGKKSNSNQTDILVEDRKVLGVKAHDIGQDVVVAVSADEASILDGFKEMGSFSIALRNPDDTSRSKKKTKKHTKILTSVEVLE